MIKRYFLFFLLLVACGFVARPQYSNASLGQWRDHLSYYSTHRVDDMGSKVLVSSEYSLFYVNKYTMQTERFSKVNGLSDAGVGVSAYDSKTQTMVITYDNSNIDIVHKEKVYNVSDIKDRSIEGSKSINSIYFHDGKAYLSCGFGIVVLDLERKEIFDTYYIGTNSSAISVNAVSINDTAIFAATVNGLMYAPVNSGALAASESWKVIPTPYYPSQKTIDRLIQINPKELMVSVAKDGTTLSTVYTFDGTSWDTVFKEEYFENIRMSGDKVITFGYRSMNIYDAEHFDTDASLFHLSDTWNPLPGISLDIHDAMIDGDDLWIAHDYEGVIYYPDYMNDSKQMKKLYPDGPMANEVFSITASNDGKIYVAHGGKTIQNAARGFPANIYTFDGYYWRALDKTPEQDSIKDILRLTIDPNDNNHIMAASWWSGVVEIRNNKIVNLYTQHNTNNVLVPHPYSFRIADVAYDASGNLLVANSMTKDGLCYLNYHGVWGSFETYSWIGDNDILGMALDKNYHYKFLWTANNKILVMDNDGNKIFLDPNRGSLDQTTAVNCITQDMDGEMWIGTNKGVKVAFNIENVFDTDDGVTSTTECQNIVYQEEGIAQYLLNFENVNCIMIDGGNRKWIGTERNGVYVFSSNGSEQLYHFTAENSPLFSNRVVSMAQNELTGEVFIGTDRGLISYRAESLKAAEEAGKLTVYPNPLRPNHSGTIAIKGFVADSDVRITDVSGRAVAHLRSIGGQAVWDGRNYEGELVPSGVYLIFSSAESGKQTACGKVLIIR